MLTAINTVWVVLAGALVFFMEGGFALLEAGLVQSKNTLSIVMKVMADVTLGSLVFFTLGYGIMFGPSHNGWMAWPAGGLAHVPSPAHLPAPVFWFFEMAFAVAAISIVSGAVSERMRFSAYLIFIVIGIIGYSLVGHWVWNPTGWLAHLGMRDFAGSAVVHTFGGFAALAAAWLVGPRQDRFGRQATEFRPSNLPLAFAGTFILWFGWFGFNAGSTLSAVSPLIGPVVLNTMLAGAAAGLAAILWSRRRQGRYDPTMAINGVLAGLVAITAGCAYVSPDASLAIGTVAGVIVYEGTPLLERMHIDDPVGAFPVHGLNGIWGTVAVGLFAVHGGLLTGGGMHLLAIQALGALVIAGFAFLLTAVSLGLIRQAMAIRVHPLAERQGLDLALHGIQAYSRDTVRAEHPAPRRTSPTEAVD